MAPEPGKRRSLSRHLLLQLAADEAARDGKLEPAEKGLLERLTAALKLEAAAPAEAMARSRERLAAGKLGRPRPLDPKHLHKKAVAAAFREGEPGEQDRKLLEVFRAVLELSREDHEAVLAIVRNSPRPPPASADSPAPTASGEIPLAPAETSPEVRVPPAAPVEIEPPAPRVAPPAVDRAPPAARTRTRGRRPAEPSEAAPEDADAALGELRQAHSLIQEGKFSAANRLVDQLLVRVHEPALREIATLAKKAAVPPIREVPPNYGVVAGLLVAAFVSGAATLTPVVRLNQVQGMILAVAFAVGAVVAFASSTGLSGRGVTINRLLSRKTIPWNRIAAVEATTSKILMNGNHVQNEVAIVLTLREGGTVTFKGSDPANGGREYHGIAVALCDFIGCRDRLGQLLAGANR